MRICVSVAREEVSRNLSGGKSASKRSFVSDQGRNRERICILFPVFEERLRVVATVPVCRYNTRVRVEAITHHHQRPLRARYCMIRSLERRFNDLIITPLVNDRDDFTV